MKVNMNQIPEKDTKQKPVKEPKPKKEKSERKSPVPAKNSGNDADASKESPGSFTDKLKSGEIFRKNKFWIILIAVLGVIALAVNSNFSNAKTRLTMQIRHTESHIANLNNAIDDVKADLEEQARIDSVQLTEEEEASAKHDAILQGEYVATLQNAYPRLDMETQREAFNNNKQALEACFDANTRNSGVEWYPSANGIPGTWKFVSQRSFYGTTAKVLWLCYADDNSILAYCTARYNADTKLFSELEYKVTRYALANMKPEEPTGTDAEAGTSIQDAFQNMANNGEGTNTPDASQDFDQSTIDNNNDVSDARDSYKDSAANGELDGEEFDDRYQPGLGSSSSDDEDDPEESSELSDDGSEGSYFDEDGNEIIGSSQN